MEEEDYLIKECEIISNRILSVWLNSVRIIVIGITLLIGLLGLAYRGIGLAGGTMKEVLVLLPIGFFFLLYYAIYLFTEVNSLGGYKKFLEGKLNERAGTDIFLWESKVSPMMRKCTSTTLLFVYIGFLCCASIYVGYDSVSDSFNKFLFILIISLLFVGLIFSFISMNKKYGETYRLVKKIEAEREKSKCEDSQTNELT